MIRLAQEEDAPDMAAIHNGIIAQTAPVVTFTDIPRRVEDVAERLAQTPHWVAVDAADRAQGFCTYGPFRSGPGYRSTVEHAIHLADAARGRGMGRALMSRLEAHLIEEGIHMCVAGIGGENERALAFHSKFGFRETARMPQIARKAGRWQTLVLMQKPLLEPAPGR